MGVFDFVKNGVREMMIARPDNQKHLLCFKHPDQNFPMYSQLTVDSDEVAVFFKDGRVVGVLPPGRHTLQTQNIPFLNNIVNHFTGGQVFIAELYFVRMTPKRNIPYGDKLGDMVDPLTSEVVGPRVYGEFSLQVVDPVRFVIGYHGQSGYGDRDNDDWIKKLFMIGVRTVLGEVCEVEGKSLLQVVSITEKLVQAIMARAPNLAEMGVRIVGMGPPNINFNDEDRARLVRAQAEVAAVDREVKMKQKLVAAAKAEADARQFGLDQKFNQDARYVQNLAGNWQNYAAGQAIIGAGQGMAEHGVGGGLAGLGAEVAIGASVGGAMAGAFQNQPQFGVGGAPQAGQAGPAGGGGASVQGALLTCSKCGARQPVGKFCSECGTSLAAKKICAGCSQELVPPTVKFCANCGTSTAAPANPA
ncbi:SPFH domain-containing protein [Pendulispora albinea]|uniref:SPFH domain-containing protein n=1 Tax=Pendulispora albinea TaxID=2741071 RepID=A0ABZ2LQE2_9BACT